MTDRVWLLVNKNTGSIWYSPPSTSPSNCWHNAEEWEQWCQGGASIIGWKQEMIRKGWKAAQVEMRRMGSGKRD